MSKILEYFRGVNSYLTSQPRKYKVGAYGCGSVCEETRNSGLVDYTYLAGSTGWNGFGTHLDSSKYTLRQYLSTVSAGVGVDPVITYKDDIGSWNAIQPVNNTGEE